jgi:hypothetical protein
MFSENASNYSITLAMPSDYVEGSLRGSLSSSVPRSVDGDDYAETALFLAQH